MQREIEDWFASRQGDLDAVFFQRFVIRAVPRGPLAPLPRPAIKAAAEASAPAAAAATAVQATSVVAAATPALAVTVADPSDPAPLRLYSSRRDDTAQLKLAVAVQGYVHRYAQSPSTQAIQRIFPNRFARDPRVAPDQAITLPGASRFKLPSFDAIREQLSRASGTPVLRAQAKLIAP